MRIALAIAATALTFWIFWMVVRASIEFEEFCVQLARMRGELLEIDVGYGDESLGPYRSKIRRALLKPSDDGFIPAELKAEAADLGDRMLLSYQLGIAWLVILGAVVFFSSP